MAKRKLTQVYLDDDQKVALDKLAHDQGVSVAELIRQSVDMTIDGVTPEELQQLDAMSRKAADDIAVMRDSLRNMHVQYRHFFEQINKQRQVALDNPAYKEQGGVIHEHYS